MTVFRLLGAAALLVLGACFGERDLEVRTISLDHLTAVQAMELAKPYLSKDGMVFHSKEMLNSISVKDHSRNVDRIRNLLSSRDASPANVALHDALEVGVGRLPERLPVVGTGIAPAGYDEHARRHDRLWTQGGGKRRSPFFQAICSATSRGSCRSQACTASDADATASHRDVTHVSVPTRKRSGWRTKSVRHSGSVPNKRCLRSPYWRPRWWRRQ